MEPTPLPSAQTAPIAPSAPLAEAAARPTAIPAALALFAVSTFASAFLIFLVQPLVGKRIVPWFGGVPAVWSLCLAFYQTALFAGYAYAHLLIRRASPRAQLVVHAILVAGAALALPVLPGDAWKPEPGADPSAAILAMLLANVALPFAALAATGPLVAAWFARRFPDRSPYPLYAVSNAGSLLALLVYPFGLEPRLALSSTGRLWSIAFVVTGGAVLACAELARRTARTAPAPEAATPLEPARAALWVLLAGCAVAVLMATTNELCLDVASVPFLWILPLALYLATLILCFGSARIYRRPAFLALAALALFGAQVLGWFEVLPAVVSAFGSVIAFQTFRYSLVLFAICMLLHGELYRLRPPAGALTAFYLCVSGGGALGGLAVGLVAPRVFDDFHELSVSLGLAWLLLLAAWRADALGWLRRGAPLWRWAGVAVLTISIFGNEAQKLFEPNPILLHQERSFFGVLRVEARGNNKAQHVLTHGSTMHGLQTLKTPERPTSYYGVHTGIGIALRRAEGAPALRIGVIGLGTGTLAAYAREGDELRYYEIDPAVIRIARDPRYFTFLSQCKAHIEIAEGDGRISLARERASGAPRFDVLAVDAYASDAVPVHLLTREAIALYLDAIEPSGLLAIHISSRHFDLLPVLARLASEAGIDAISIESVGMPAQFSQPSSWVFLSRDAERLRTLARTAELRGRQLRLPAERQMVRPATPGMIAHAPLWTDDYSNLYRVLSSSGSRPAAMDRSLR